MKLRLLFLAFLSALLFSCSGNKTAERWAQFPLSHEIDAAQLAAQIRANPGDWEAAADFLSRTDLATAELGKYPLTDNGCYANIQEYSTRAESKFEAHKDFIDVQVVLSGKEHIFVSALGDLRDRLADYNPAKDIEFFASSVNPRTVLADKDNWVILFPSDAHMPCMTIGQEPSSIRKVVIKVPFAE